jgi:hypothetical protein
MIPTKREPVLVYQRLASLVLQRSNCIAHKNEEWFHKSTERIHEIVKNHLPSGSGVDNGTRIDLEKSTEEKLVFQADFHHMNEWGCYDGWTEHTVTVRASLFDRFTVTVSGRNRNQIKDHIAELFYWALRETVPEEA